MKRKSLLIMLLVALFVPLAMNAQTKSLKKSANGSKPKLEMRVSKEMPSNPMLTKLESAKEAALEELDGRGERATNELLTQGFESMNSISTTYSSTGWYAYNAGRGNNWTLNTSSTYANNGSKSAQYEYNSRNAANCYLVSAPFTVSSNMSELTVSLYERARGNYPETFEVFFVKASDVTTLEGVASATKYNAIASDSYTNTTYAQQSGTVTNSALAGQSVRVVVHCTSAADQWYLYIDDITVNEKTVEEGCSAPENFASSNVTSNSVTLSWTETGTSEEWAILYMCEEDEEAQVEFTTTNPFTLTGLNPATYYVAEVIPMCGDYDQESEVIEFTTQDLPCAKPTNLNASNLTPSSATVSWSGEADSYTLQYRPAAENGGAILFQGFESGSLDNWTAIRNGGGTTNTDWRVINPETTFENGDPAHGGSYVVMSRSWASSAYSVDNWLISPQFTLGGTLKYWVMDDGQYHETYYICVSTTGNSVNNFTRIYSPGNATGSWTEVTVDLSAYEGRAGYIAFNHVDRDQDYLFIDDIGVYGEEEPASGWVTVNNVTSPYTIPGLDSETTYEWQVQGDCGSDGLSLWSDISTFTTPSTCGIPTGLTTTDITNNSATLSWNEVLDSYNVRYRKGFVYDFESATPWVEDNFSPCTTYDGDGLTTYQVTDWTPLGTYQFVGSMMTFQNGVTDFGASHGGNLFGGFVDGIPDNGATNNDFFITPSITIESGDVFEFWASSLLDNWGLERMKVGVYGGNGTISHYFAGSASTYVEVPNGWTKYSYDLSQYAGQTIQLAINCVSNDAYILAIDDIYVGNDADWSNPIPVTGASYTLTGLDMNTEYVFQVQGVNCDGDGGTTNWSGSASFTTLNGTLVESIEADDVTVTIGQTAPITGLEVLPTDATNPAVTYTSNDETVATVTDAGVVTGVAVGTTTITIAATDGSNVSTTINVTVNGIDVTGITAEDVEVVTGETATITYTVAPANATDQSVTFTSANTAIATVDANGVVTGVSVGETTITIASVSNPEFTAEITVTVTSNPNAVQFTVNAPETAHPGDVITVDFMLAAPTAGTYTGFTGLDVNLYFETAAFQYNSKANGAVADAASAIEMSQVVISGPNTNNPNRVRALLVTPANYPVTAEGIVFSATFTVLQDVELGSYTFDATIAEFDYTIDISNVVDIPYEFTPSTVTIAALEQYTKHIIGYNSEEGNGTGNYYLIASPIGNVAPTEVTNMTSGSYDLFYFDHSRDLEWVNYKQQTGSTNPGFGLVSGKGYLYANSQTVDLVFTGTARSTEDVTINLDYTDTADGYTIDMPGWNLVGNPFAVNAFFEDNRGFYTLNSAGTEFETVPAGDGRVINAMEGVFVEASATGQSVTFTTTQPAKKGSRLGLNVSNGISVIDRAFVSFGEGQPLHKLQLDRNHTKVYIPQDGQDYAIVCSEEMGETPVNFKAENNGTYSLNVSSQNAEFAYLHLIDNLTGNDIDLLQTPSYSFEAKTTDYESRFKLVFATGNSNGDTFAFFSNGSFVINNEGNATLQVIDVTGRILKSESINGCTNVNVNATPGVYMLRLINGDNVKVQKVVVK